MVNVTVYAKYDFYSLLSLFECHISNTYERGSDKRALRAF